MNWIDYYFLSLNVFCISKEMEIRLIIEICGIYDWDVLIYIWYLKVFIICLFVEIVWLLK